MAPSQFDDVLFSGTVLRVDVTTQTGCGWSASSNSTWITVSSGANGTGSGRVDLTVAANAGSARAGTAMIAGRTVTVNQQGRPACAYSISPTSYAPTSAGGAVSVAVKTTEDCEWTVTNTTAWATAMPNSLTGSGTTTVTVQPNSGAARSATLKIANADFVVQQASAPCTYLYRPTMWTIPAYPTATREIGITTQAHCPVAADVNVPWIEIMDAPAFGSGEIEIRIFENKGGERTGIVTVTGENSILQVTITQKAAK